MDWATRRRAAATTAASIIRPSTTAIPEPVATAASKAAMTARAH